MKTSSFNLVVTKKDGRCVSDRRLIGTYKYINVEHQWMLEEVRDLKSTVYKPQDGYLVEINEVVGAE